MKLLEKRKKLKKRRRKRQTRGKLFSTFASYLRTFGKHFTNTSRQYHQHFTRAFFVWKSFWQLFSSCVLAKKHFRTKNTRVKCWCNGHQGQFDHPFSDEHKCTSRQSSISFHQQNCTQVYQFTQLHSVSWI